MKKSDLEQLIREELRTAISGTDEYTDEEMLQRTTISQLPPNWTLLDVISHYDDHILGYLKNKF